MERETESIENNKFILQHSLKELRRVVNGEKPKSGFPPDASSAIDGALHAIKRLQGFMIDVSVEKNKLLTLEEELLKKGLLKKAIAASRISRPIENPSQTIVKDKQRILEKNSGRPTREEVAKKAAEFVQRMQGRDHGDIHNQIVGWSRGENLEEAQRYYPDWTKEDFRLYAQEIKKLEPESEWGTALYEV